MSILSATQVDTVKNYVGGEWKSSQSAELINVVNPATQKILAAVPASDAAEVNAAIAAASKAFPAWRATPPEDRIQYLFKLKQLLEEHFDEIARITTTENGKTLAEAQCRTAARHRECRGRLRHSHANAGLQPGRRSARD